ncbi:MAG: efflux RND transporter periplasmic adaptor subunit [Planctomycetes bacterium]|nr:efflux RND transporter periplasmic adaptor subunit [Planctomycetota bacterium]
MPRSPNPITLLLAALLLLASTAISCGRPPAAIEGERTDDHNSSNSEFASIAENDRGAVKLERVRTMPVVQESIELALDAVANVESLDVVDVVPERAEPVLEILVEEGEQVTAGQALARMRDRIAQLAVRDAEVRVTEAENELTRATRDYKRNEQLAEQVDGASLLSERDLETSEQAVLAAETALASAKVALDQAQLEVDRCTLTAPIDGTVTARDISVGDQTTLGQRAFEITDLENPRVVFYRPQSELAALRVGQRLSATTEAYRDRPIAGTIERIAPIVDQESGTIKVTALLAPPEGAPLPTGLLVRLRLVLDEHPDALLVPKRALIYQEDRILAFVVREGNAVQIKLEPGFENPTHLEHLGKGLSVEDVVVTVGQDRLEDGEAVKVLPE